MTVHREPRRANLATIVGSSLAVVAAGSLLAFSSLAEQAGLEGLATGGLQPTRPGRSGGGTHAITIPAPATDAPRDPRDVLAELVRESGRDRVQTLVPVETATPAPRPRQETSEQETSEPKAPRRIENRARVAVAPPDVDGEKTVSRDGPPYGHAYGHYEKKQKAPKPHADGQPVHARSANGGGKVKPAKGQKLHKVEKVEKEKVASPGNGKGNGKANGHSKHGNGNGKARGHSKHAHKGKGKGHSKHGG